MRFNKTLSVLFSWNFAAVNQHCYTDWDETVRTCQLISTPSLSTQPIKPVHTLPGPRLFLFTSSSLGSLGSLSKDVFERRTSTGSEAFSLFICLDTTKFVLLSFFSPIKTIYPRVSTKPQPNAAKSPLPVDVRRSKTLLLKLPFLGVSKTRG